MRGLQRLRHAQPATHEETASHRLAVVREIRSRERRLWLYRLRRALPWAVVLLILGAGVRLLSGLSNVADALTHSSSVVVSAPAKVRVAEIFLRPGQSCRRGDPLLRLEALESQAERASFVALVEEHRLRLEWFDAGGEVEEFGRPLRVDLLADAERQAAQASEEIAVVTARIAALRREREDLRLAGMENSARERGNVAVRTEDGIVARTRLEEARSEKELADFESLAASQLHSDGVVAERAVIEKRTERDGSVQTIEGLIATVIARGHELATGMELSELADQRAEQALAVIDARIETAQAELRATQTKQAGWQTMVEHHRRLAPLVPTEAGRVRALRRQLLSAELAGSRARLEDFDERHGEGLVSALADGIVDRVLVDAGAVVDRDTPLMTYYDPELVRVVAYVTPELAAELTIGEACKIVPEGGGDTLDAHVVSIGAAWVECPKTLPKRSSRTVDLRVPVAIAISQPHDKRRITPNMRMKIVIDGGGLAGLGQHLSRFLDF